MELNEERARATELWATTMFSPMVFRIVAKRMEEDFDHLEYETVFHIASKGEYNETAEGDDCLVLMRSKGIDDEEAM